MLKSLISVLAGLVAGMPAVFIIETIGRRIYPPPADVDFSDRAAVADMITTLPAGAFAFVLLGWVAGALVASAVAARLSRRSRPAYIATAVLLGLCALNFFMFPHPAWMIAATVVLVPGAGLLGARMFARP